MKSENLPYQAKPGEDLHSFTNEYGERWAVVFNEASGDGVLLGDEIGWGIEDGLPLSSLPEDLILSLDEQNWLFSCWDAFLLKRTIKCAEDN